MYKDHLIGTVQKYLCFLSLHDIDPIVFFSFFLCFVWFSICPMVDLTRTKKKPNQIHAVAFLYIFGRQTISTFPYCPNECAVYYYNIQKSECESFPNVQLFLFFIFKLSRKIGEIYWAMVYGCWPLMLLLKITSTYPPNFLPYLQSVYLW